MKRLIWIALLCAGLAVQLGLLVIPGIILPTGIALLVLFGIPGFVLTRFIVGHDDLSPLETVGFSVVLGLGLLILPGTVLLIAQAALTDLIWVSLGLNTALVLLYVLAYRERQEAASPPSGAAGDRKPRALVRAWGALWGANTPNRQFLVLSVLLVALATALLTFFALEVRMWEKSDGWSYAAYLRRYMVEDTLNPYGTISTQSDARFALSTWIGMLAAVGHVAQVDPNALYWAGLIPTLGAAAFLSFYALAKTLFRSASTAILASIVQIVYYASSLYRDTGGRVWAGSGLMKRIQEDKYAAVWIVAPITLALAYKFLEKGRIRHLLGFVLVATAATIVHPMGYVSLILTLGSFLLIHVIAALWPLAGADRAPSAPAAGRAPRLVSMLVQNKATISRFVVMLAILGVLALLPWFARQALVEGGSRAFAPQDPERLLDVYEQARHLVVFAPGWFMASPSLLWHPMILLALILTPFLVRNLRQSRPAQFLFAGMTIPLLLIYNPLTASLLASLITPSQIWRIRLFLPVGLVVGFVMADLLGSLLQRALRSTSAKAAGTYQALLALLTVAILALLLRGPFQQGVAEIRLERTEPGLTVAEFEQDILEQLDAELVTDHAVVVADARISDYVPAFTNKATLLFFRGKVNRDVVGDTELSNEEMRIQIDALYDTTAVNAEVIDWMDRYDAELLVVSKSSPLFQALSMIPSAFTLQYANEGYALYRVAADPATNPAVQGEILLLEGDLAGAEENLQQAILQSPDSFVPYLGMAKIRLMESRPEDAFEYLARAHALLPDLDAAVDTFVWAIDVAPEYILEYTRDGLVYQTPEALNVVSSLLDQVEEARLSPSGENLVYRSTAVIDRKPLGVLFEHPPSRIEFSVQVPTNARLEYSIALAPGAWSIGKGDGVQFDLTLDDQSGVTTRLASEYIDPKNLPEQRKWQERSVDLSRWSGQAVTVTFTTGPGPNGNEQYDWAIWGEPRIVQPVAYDLIDAFPSTEVSGDGVAEITTRLVGYQAHPALAQQPPSRVVYPVELPLQSELRFRFYSDATSGSGAGCVIYVRDPGPPSRLYVVFEANTPPVGLSNPSWVGERVDLSAFGGRTIDIIFECQAVRNGEQLASSTFWGTPLIVDTGSPPGISGTSEP
ncbi:MAG: hypothetical protein JXA93_24870 [Anaerolineae bacterium]|nr:hypothetical protein [Anaerolineae bacterium]